ncbi:hypothetical protein YC2023_109493 [Brassica napus]
MRNLISTLQGGRCKKLGGTMQVERKRESRERKHQRPVARPSAYVPAPLVPFLFISL